MKTGGAESPGFEPTVFSAVRRYWTMVLAVALAGAVAAIGYTLVQPKIYVATGSITVPPTTLQAQDPAQSLDSQVLLLNSQDVAQRAAGIANRALHSDQLDAGNFSGSGSSLVVIPPATGSSGVYGDSIITVKFSGPSAQIAQAGANAVLQAFDNARNADIIAAAHATVVGIDRIIDATTNSPDQQAALKTQRMQVLANEQTDLAHAPTVLWALAPPKNSQGWKRAGLVGLVIGIVLGATLAYVRANMRRGFADRQDPAALYGVPLIGEIPAFEAKKMSRSNGTAATGLLPIAGDPHSAAAETFRFAAGSLERIRAERGPRLSLVFVSPLADVGKSLVVANLALAIAEGGTRVLAVDADPGNGDLTARLLPDTPARGLEQVLAGQQQLTDCIHLSPLNGAVAVLGSGLAPQRRVTGAARAKAALALLATAKSSFDVVLIDSPALLQVADATELLDASDAAVIVLGPNELIRDHLEMVDRLKLVGTDVVGYIYNRAPMRPHLAHSYWRSGNGSSAEPADLRAAPPPSAGHQPVDANGRSHPSPQASDE
jgi:Mrp family chromosome partitioning ATPase/capsular polysaccharide biosynthesis protein